ncbi:tetratricopeptide repeat protein [Campylobacter ureolyticus]|uniref:Tetratricopeptide repeat protein n=1 Tax=Campylobacter ureolyticus TaxID=827 RepID=A0A9Q4KPQ9_9BACT|nr:tetratricopeptide repeat protein [Campylobacter ureolyticus]MCZ6103819.1 hypothetical protein [Campylobacter ureolyticus]MCZ6134729.1 hypothetical protein [Campylobacter ureolyticus]MCZ6162015.1 hypothetical protein [Campylobacter ureolyticus]MCZ6170910.1 hypothetical protein [Campylobacter ureolyticus]MDU4981488.1 hypothetical protein [Campylobacter ureolyticus]
MRKILSMVVFLGTTILAQEVSVFGAGNIASENPYGLTENEQVLLSNKKRVDEVESKLNSYSEDVIGVKSVVEGANSQIAKLESRVSDLEIRTTGKVSKLANKQTSVVTEQDILGLRNDIADLKRQVEIINQKLEINVKKNSEVVVATKNQPKKEFTKKQEALPQLNKLETKEIQTKNTNKVVAFDDMKPSEIEKIAHRLFNENKYIESKIHYEYLASKKYNLAKTNFMLGEIAFNQKSYANAIKNYQESIKNDDKADYMPKLLLNAGISLEKIGDKNNADKFFKVLKSQFPNSPQAKSLK